MVDVEEIIGVVISVSTLYYLERELISPQSSRIVRMRHFRMLTVVINIVRFSDDNGETWSKFN